MDTFGALIDKLCTVDLKMWNNQEILYEIRRMSFEEFKITYTKDEESISKLWTVLKRACDINVQRNALIDEIDERLVSITNLEDDGKNVQRKHKTY